MDKRIADLINANKAGDRSRIQRCEENLAQNIKEYSTNRDFFNIPLANILNIISKADFTTLDDSDIINTVSNIINSFVGDKERIKNELLAHINTDGFDNNKYLAVIEGINKSVAPLPQFFIDFSNFYENKKKLVEIDYSHRIKEKDNQIRNLQNNINVLHDQIKKINDQINKSKDQINKFNDYSADIFTATMLGNLENVKWLVKKGVPADSVDQNRDTPVHIAAAYGHLNIVKYLIKEQNIPVYIKGDNDRTPLHYAAAYGHDEIISYLLSKGADVNAINSVGESPLINASHWGLLSTVKLLLSNGANKSYTSKHGVTAYKSVCKSGNNKENCHELEELLRF